MLHAHQQPTGGTGKQSRHQRLGDLYRLIKDLAGLQQLNHAVHCHQFVGPAGHHQLDLFGQPQSRLLLGADHFLHAGSHLVKGQRHGSQLIMANDRRPVMQVTIHHPSRSLVGTADDQDAGALRILEVLLGVLVEVGHQGPKAVDQAPALFGQGDIRRCVS